MDKERTQTATVETTAEPSEREAKRAAAIRRILLIVSILAGIGLGLLMARSKPEETTVKLFQAEGIQIPLAVRFAETGDRDGYDRVYRSNHEAVLVRQERFETDPELAELTAEDYARRLAQGLPGAGEPRPENGILCFEYEADYDGSPSRYLVAVYRGSGAFWQLRFVCKTGSFEKYREDFLQFAAGVSVE